MMMPKTITAEPVWEIVKLFPPQGYWSLDHYVTLDASTNHLIEFSNGAIEILPMPSIQHQRLVRALFHWLFMYVQQHNLGEVFFAPTKVELWENKICEPDVFFVSHANLPHHTEQWFQQIDLAIEVISPDDPNRDLEIKRHEYAQAGIAEYWIVDPRSDKITVLTLAGTHYEVHGVFGKEDAVTSVLLPGFSVRLADGLV
ncbi:MAG: Uma2 family endonuclease [Anaerolineales bacterium]|nr:Uma2 family endonuclease [Anaerolineales bacterium]